MDTPKPQWTEIAEQVYKALEVIVTDQFAGYLDRMDIVHGAYFRMMPAYESAVRRGAIRKLESWFYVKGRTCARDERKMLLGLRRETSELSLHHPEQGSEDSRPLIETERVNQPVRAAHHFSYQEMFMLQIITELPMYLDLIPSPKGPDGWANVDLLCRYFMPRSEWWVRSRSPKPRFQMTPLGT